MATPNEQKVKVVLATLAANKITTEEAVSALSRLIGQAFYRGLQAPEHGTEKARPRQKTRS